MSAARKSVPSYLPHTQSGRARVVWTDPTGTRRSRLLPGAFGSDESRAAYRRLLAELESTPLPTPDALAGLPLAEVLLAFLRHAERHYLDPDGRPTSEFREYRLVVRTLRQLYGSDPAAGVGPLALKAVRQTWVVAGLARSEVNQRVGLARRIFKWAAGEELVPFPVYQSLSAVAGLQKGRTRARETETVGPVAAAHVDATLPHLNRHVRGLIEFVRLTGCRPGEACRLRWADIDTSGAVWVFRPTTLKNAHRGKDRAIAVGPRAQDLLAGFPPADPAAYVFRPRAAMDEFHAARSAARRTPRFPSHMARNAAKRWAGARPAPGVRYAPKSVSQAVERAVARANRAGMKAAPGSYVPIPLWHPNQLRHAHATAVRKRFGLEAAQVAMGHERADVTQLYAEKNLALAAKVAAELG